MQKLMMTVKRSQRLRKQTALTSQRTVSIPKKIRLNPQPEKPTTNQRALVVCPQIPVICRESFTLTEGL
jgi:hypothetical protein